MTSEYRQKLEEVFMQCAEKALQENLSRTTNTISISVLTNKDTVKVIGACNWCAICVETAFDDYIKVRACWFGDTKEITQRIISPITAPNIILDYEKFFAMTLRGIIYDMMQHIVELYVPLKVKQFFVESGDYLIHEKSWHAGRAFSDMNQYPVEFERIV